MQVRTRCGVMGKILWVDLSAGTCREEVIPAEIYEQYLSGLGLAAWLLYRLIPPGADPLGPENVLGFVSGLLTGTGSLFTGRWMAVGKSPLTGTWGDANCGGTLAAAIKHCGWDGIFFTGIGPEPVYLYADNHGAQLRDAAALWGQDAVETGRILQEQHRENEKKPAVACIGPAGERLSLIAGIVDDGGRLAARSGLGAVMGSKRLKAVVLAGSSPIPVHDPAAMRALSRRCRGRIRSAPRLPAHGLMRHAGALLRRLPFGIAQDGLLLASFLRQWGTVGSTGLSVEMGDTPVKNWLGNLRDFKTSISKTLDGDRVTATETRKYHCYSCPLGCGGIVRHAGVESHKPEYETIAAFTTNLMNEDLDLVFRVNDLLNRAGMDTISAGSVVGFAMECYARGIITPEATGGLELTWGNGPAILALVRQMVAREGIGDLLADGVKKAAERLGRGAPEAAVHSGGQEIGFHDPRLDPGYAVHASVEPTPGRHTTGSLQYYDLYRLWTRLPGLPKPPLLNRRGSLHAASPEKAAREAATSQYVQLYNGAGACMFGALLGADRLPLFEWLNAATGWSRTPADYLRVGRRIQTVRQMFNLRQGVDPRRQKVNARLRGDPPLAAGPNRGAHFDLDAMMQAYWQAMGWDPVTGTPTPETIRSLGLETVLAETCAPASGATDRGAADSGAEAAPAYLIGEACTGCTACARLCPVGAIRGQRGSTHVIDPSVCIRCGACGRTCPVEAVLDPRGVACHTIKRAEWPRPAVDAKQCVSCGACLQDCPVSVLAWAAPEGRSLHLTPVLAEARACIGCAFCAQNCPVEAIIMKTPGTAA